MRYDLAIIGGGLSGLSAAYIAASRNMKVAVFESGTLGKNASSGLVGALAPHMPENWNAKKQYQFEALENADMFWANIANVSGIDPGFRRNGRLQAIRDEAELKKALMREEAAKSSWRGRYKYEVRPQFKRPFANARFGTIYDDLSAQIFPRAAMVALGYACATIGVEIYENALVEDWSDGEVYVGGQIIQTRAVLIAAGFEGWPLLRRYLGADFGEGTKGQAALIQPSKPWKYPMLTGDGFYVVAHKSDLLGVGSTSERYWSHRETDDNLTALLRRIGEELPDLSKHKLISSWAGIRPRAYRPDPLIGRISEGVYVHAGGFKTGFGFAHKLSEDLVSHIEGDILDVPDGFRPQVKSQIVSNA